MSRFRLSGLLRARTVQEEQARRALGGAQARVVAADVDLRRSEATLASAGAVPGGSASEFLAAAAARSSMAAAVGEAVALRAASRSDLAEARSEWLEARMRARAVERLAERHRQQQAVERAHAEQLLSDDLAGARHAARGHVDGRAQA